MPCIKKQRIKKKVKKEEETRGSVGEKRERKGENDFLLLSKIYDDRIDGFHRSKRQSSFMHRELRVGTKILEFQVGNVPTWVISSLKAIYWLEVFLEAVRGHKFQSQIFGTECRNF